MTLSVSAEFGVSSHVAEWERYGFRVSSQPLPTDGKHHEVPGCHQELKIALIRYNGHTEYMVVCYLCSQLFRTGIRYSKKAVSDRAVRAAAATWHEVTP